MNKRAVQGKATYDLLINSALELASEGGLQNITAGKLSSKVQISKSSVFHHFNTTLQVLIKQYLFHI